MCYTKLKNKLDLIADKVIEWLFPTFEKFAAKALLLTGLAMFSFRPLDWALVSMSILSKAQDQNGVEALISGILNFYDPIWGLVLILFSLTFWLLNKLIDKMRDYQQAMKDENDRSRFSKLLPHIPEISVKQMLYDLKAQQTFLGISDDQLDNLIDVLSLQVYRFNNALIEKDRQELIETASNLRAFCTMNMFPHAHYLCLRPDQKFNTQSTDAQQYYQQKAAKLIDLARETDQAYDIFREHLSIALHV